MIYLVTRTDDIRYYEYAGFIVKADSEDEAVQICIEKTKGRPEEFKSDNIKVHIIDESVPKGIILEDFRGD